VSVFWDGSPVVLIIEKMLVKHPATLRILRGGKHPGCFGLSEFGCVFSALCALPITLDLLSKLPEIGHVAHVDSVAEFIDGGKPKNHSQCVFSGRSFWSREAGRPAIWLW
jgi:hypothetical protein